MKFTVKVIPGAQKSEVVAETKTTMRVRLNAVPEKGKANAELVKLLAKHFGVRKSAIEIVRGHLGREKVVEIN